MSISSYFYFHVDTELSTNTYFTIETSLINVNINYKNVYFK